MTTRDEQLAAALRVHSELIRIVELAGEADQDPRSRGLMPSGRVLLHAILAGEHLRSLVASLGDDRPAPEVGRGPIGGSAGPGE